MATSLRIPLWLRLPERGSARGLAIFVRILARAGHTIASALLVPIVAYFYATSPRARAASRAFLRRVGRPAHAGAVLRHFWRFGQCVMDRLWIVLRGPEAIGRDRGPPQMRHELRSATRGSILLGAHVGSFEALGAMGRASGLRVTAVVNHGGSRIFARTLEAIDPTWAEHVLDLDGDSLAAIFEIRRRIDRGEHVAILADRCAPGDRCATVSFLGAPARLPTGPYAIAAALRCPVMLVAAIRRGRRQYEVHAQPLADVIDLPRRDRERALAVWAARYAKWLASLAMAAPDNWFNFYDFWEAGDEHATTSV